MTENEAREILNLMLCDCRIVFLGDGTVSMASDPYTEREIEAILIGLRRHKANLLAVDITQVIGGTKK